MTFCQKVSNFVQFGLSDFVQISPAYGKKIYQGITYSILDFQC